MPTGSIDSRLEAEELSGARRFLLDNDGLFGELHARLGGVQLYKTYISLATERVKKMYPASPSKFQEFINSLVRLNLARILLDHERGRVPLTHPSDAEQREEWYNSP